MFRQALMNTHSSMQLDSEPISEADVGEETSTVQEIQCPTTVFSSPGFHLLGTKCNVIMDIQSNVTSFSIPVQTRAGLLKVKETPTEYYSRYIVRFSREVHSCTICALTVRASLNAMSAGIRHVTLNHPSLALFDDLVSMNPDYIQRIKTEFMQGNVPKDTTAKRARPTAAGGGVTVSSLVKKGGVMKSMTSHFGPVLVMKAILVRGFAMGALPLGLVENEGFKYIIKTILGPTKFDSMSMSRRTLNREMVGQFNTEKKRVCDEITMVKNTPMFLGQIRSPGRYLAMYHDAWKSIADVAFLGLRLTAMNVGLKIWVIMQWKLTCRKFPHPHTIVELRALCQEIYREFGFSEAEILAACQDTTAASIGLYRLHLLIWALKCMAHVNQLFLKRGTVR